jgi:thiol-disulfide isomerase/thioredoxin
MPRRIARGARVELGAIGALQRRPALGLREAARGNCGAEAGKEHRTAPLLRTDREPRREFQRQERWRTMPPGKSPGNPEDTMGSTIRIALAAFVLHALPAGAEIPAAYAPMAVEAPFAFTERCFDLTPALERARAEKKLVLVYLGASNCPYCKQYERFLGANRDALAPVYSQLVVADIRTHLTGPDVYFQVGKRKYSFKEFNALVGDGNGRVTYPRYWLITADMKPAEEASLGLDVLPRPGGTQAPPRAPDLAPPGIRAACERHIVAIAEITPLVSPGALLRTALLPAVSN